MTKLIEQDYTILDYLDLKLELAVLQDKSLFLIYLDKQEWNQLQNLIRLNYKQCKSVLTEIFDTLIRYKDIYLSLDCDSSNDIDYYMYSFDALRDVVRRTRDRVNNPHQNATEELFLQSVPTQSVPTPVNRDIRFATLDGATNGGGAAYSFAHPRPATFDNPVVMPQYVPEPLWQTVGFEGSPIPQNNRNLDVPF